MSSVTDRTAVTDRRRWLLGAATVTVTVLAVLPDLLRLDRYPPFAQVVPFRPVVVVAALMLAVFLALRRRLRPTAAAVALIALAGTAVLVPRTLTGGPAADAAPSAVGKLTVLTLNVAGGDADVTALADIIRRERPDLVSLPEAGPGYAAELGRALSGTGYRVRSAPDREIDDPDGVAVAIAPTLPGAHAVAGPRGVFPTLEVVGGALGAVRFVAFHAAAPVPSDTGSWVADLQRLRPYCEGDQPVLIAGDLNATLDHSVLRRAMRGCADVAAEIGRGLVPTWRSGWPRWFGVQIDHVLVGEGLAPTAFDVREVPGTDHRAVLAHITLRPPRQASMSRWEAPS